MWHCGAGTTTQHACDTRELTSHSWVRVKVRIRVTVRVVVQACGIIAVGAGTSMPHACDTRDLRDVDYQIRDGPTLRCTH